ncbi:strawberry notch C-terminal domain-containing protein [Burkholderia sp. Tr-20390]|uniref:strawberry notch C-terminal domain-containing protein n=1 Tax=Burkholderia sp. Tr-20390 TaxID=2703904 RepID=UPI00197D6E26|nr:strawberry notch C-terminal domain-containing protein [Burkholderia sp. Tr-20390]MBN3729397.1 helicase [Burkholderia sp. Tr-20390]
MVAKSAEVTWVDLSAIGVYMGSWQHPSDPSKSLPLAMVDMGGAHEAAIRKLGFRPMTGVKAAGIYVRDDTAVSREMLHEAFGQKNVRFVRGAREAITGIFQRQFREKTQLNAKAAFAQQRALGLNHRGEVVFETALGRHVVRRVDGASRLIPEASGAPEDFLRARTRDQLRKVARGFVQRITLRRDTLRRENVQNLIALSNEGGFTPRDYQEAIEVEVGALFTREVVAAGLARGAAPLAAYDIADRIYHGMPELRERTSNSIANQQYSTPIPMSTLAQALLTCGGEPVGAAYLDPTIGNGSLVSLVAAQRAGGMAATVCGVEIDPARVESAQEVADQVVLGDATKIDYRRQFARPDGFDFVIANPPFGSMDQRETVDLPANSAVRSMSVQRLDHFLLLKSLHARKDQGRAVFITGADNVMKAGEIIGASKHLIAYLHDHYEIDGIVDVSGELYKKQGAGYPLRMYVIGDRKAVPEQTEEPKSLPVIRSYEGLRAWAEGILSVRAPEQRRQLERVDSAVDVREPQPGAGADGVIEGAGPQRVAEGTTDGQTGSAVAAQPDDARQESEFQQRYVAFSNSGEASTMIPANLSGPVYEALAQIKGEHGDIDDYVARELDYAVNDLPKYFSPEQIDALAMICSATSRKLGFLLADQMGVGKGRVLAGFARRERLQGRIPMFVTITDNLFSDFLERDIASIDSRHLFQAPLIVNDQSKTVDSDGNVIVRSMKRPDYRKHAEEGRLPEGTDLIMLTYSQLSRPQEKHLTSRYMRALCSSYPISLILDESHKGAGASNTSENLAGMINGLDVTGGNIVYSSGTPIKGAKNLSLYRRILPEGVNPEELLDAVLSDPISLQEALNYEISAQGCLISRELDNTGIEKEFVVSRYVKRNEEVADQLSEILSAMNYISGDVRKIVGNLNRDFAKQLESIPEEQRAGQRMGATSVNFASRMHALVCQMLLAMKAREIADLAIEAIEANEKPIIALQRTGESMLADYLSENSAEYDDSEERVQKDISGVTLDKPINFRDYLHKTLERLMWITTVGRYGDVTKTRAASEEIDDSAARIKQLIDALPDDLPLAPIDYLREALDARGYTLGEISGRNLRSRTLANGKVSIEPMPGRTDKTRVNRVVREFNNGDLDAIVLTGAGSTGISLQASPAVGADVRPRVMIKGEMQQDITAERQMDGRHNRTGQIERPKYKIPVTGLPADDRQAMMFNTKNRSLTASTVANRDSKEIIREVPDLLNVVGDMVAEELLKENLQLADHLDIAMKDDSDSYQKPPLYYIKVLTGRICLLRVDAQRSLYEDLQSRFHEKVDQLKAEGRNPLEVQCHDWRARRIDRRAFMGASNASTNERSQLNSPVYLSQLEYEEELKAFKASEVDNRIAFACAEGVPNVEVISKYLREQRNEILKRYTPKRFETVEAALSDKEPNETKNTAAKLTWLDENLQYLRPGAVYRQEDLEGVPIPTVIVRVGVPSKLEGYLRLSEYAFYTMRPGSDEVRLETASSLFASGIDLEWAPFAEHEEARDAFDAAENGVVTRRARVLDGNLFEATSLNLRERIGRKIVYTDEGGARQHGILVYANVSEKMLAAIPERIRDAGLVARFAEHRPVTTNRSGDWREDFGVMVRKGSAGRLELVVPGTKKWGGDIFLDEALTPIAGKESECRFHLTFRSAGGKMIATLPDDGVLGVVRYLMDHHGLSFFTREREELARIREMTGRPSANELAPA